MKIFGLALFLSIILIPVALWALRARAKDERVTAIVGGVIAICVAIISGFVALYGAAEKDRREAYRLQKIEVYSEFTDFVGKLFLGIKEDSDSEDAEIPDATVERLSKELQGDYFDLAKKLLLWGSPEVLRSYDEFRNYAIAVESSNEADDQKAYRMLCYTDRVFRAMRDDLQLDNSSLEGGELIGIFLTDPPEIKQRIKNAC